MILTVHLFCSSAHSEAGREEGFRVVIELVGKRMKKKNEKSKPPSLPPLSYCSTLFIHSPFPKHFVKSPDWSFYLCEEKYVDLLVILSIQQ